MIVLHLPQITDLGRTDLDTEVWLTRRDGRLVPVHVDDLTPRHRRNLLAYLRRNADVMWAHQRQLTASYWQTGVVDDATFAERVAHLDRTPAPEWIEDTALVRRLVALTPAEPRPERRHRFLPARLLTGGRHRR